MTSLLSESRIATRNLRRNTNRTLVAVLTVAGGVVAFLLAGGFIAWIFENMREGTIHSQLGHIQIVRPNYFEKGIADPYAFLLPAETQAWHDVEGAPHVVGVAPRLAFSGLASHGEATITFLGEGVDPQREAPVSSRITLVAGSPLSGPAAAEVLLGEGLARSLGVVPGDAMVLLVTAANGSPNAVEVKVAGTFSTYSKEFDDSALRLPIAVARKLMRVAGATSWVVLLDGTEHTASTLAALRTKLPESRFQLVPWSDLADFYNKTVVLFSKQVDVMKFIIGVIIILTISNTQVMSVLERTTEIGTSLAIGVRRRVVMRTFMIEGVVIGILGGLVGVGLGYVLAGVVSAIGIPMPPPPGMAHGYVGEILITRGLMVDSLVLALVTTFLASIMPAWRASRLNIVDALRTNQ